MKFTFHYTHTSQRTKGINCSLFKFIFIIIMPHNTKLTYLFVFYFTFDNYKINYYNNYYYDNDIWQSYLHSKCTAVCSLSPFLQWILAICSLLSSSWTATTIIIRIIIIRNRRNRKQELEKIYFTNLLLLSYFHERISITNKLLLWNYSLGKKKRK